MGRYSEFKFGIKNVYPWMFLIWKFWQAANIGWKAHFCKAMGKQWLTTRFSLLNCYIARWLICLCVGKGRYNGTQRQKNILTAQCTSTFILWRTFHGTVHKRNRWGGGFFFVKIWIYLETVQWQKNSSCESFWKGCDFVYMWKENHFTKLYYRKNINGMHS